MSISLDVRPDVSTITPPTAAMLLDSTLAGRTAADDCHPDDFNPADRVYLQASFAQSFPHLSRILSSTASR
jgi:hypothetical protein